MKRDAQAERIYEVVRLIPRGRVASYGQIAEIAGLPGRARLVGKLLGNLTEDAALPWQRVINAAGRISFPESSAHHELQRGLLEDEGVRFERGRVRDRRYWWNLDDDG